MKKILISFLILLSSGFLFSNGTIETDKYNIGFDSVSSKPEILVSLSGKIYFFYVKEDRLILEVKSKNETEFSLVEHSFFDADISILSIERFKMENNLYSLLVKTAKHGKNSLYLLRFDHNGELELLSCIDKSTVGEIDMVNLFPSIDRTFTLTYLQNDTFKYSVVNGKTITTGKLDSILADTYQIGGALEDGEIVLKGYVVDKNNILTYIRFNNNVIETRFIDDLSQKSILDHSAYLSSDGEQFYIILSGEYGVFQYHVKSNETVLTTLDYPSTLYKPYHLIDREITCKYYSLENNSLLFDNDFTIPDVKEFFFNGNNVYYITTDNSLKIYDLLNKKYKDLEIGNVVDYGTVNRNYTNFLFIATKVGIEYKIEVFTLNENNNSSIMGFELSEDEYKEYVGDDLSLQKRLNSNIQLHMDYLNKDFRFIDTKNILKEFYSSSIISNQNNFGDLQSYLFLTEIDGINYIEVAK